MKDKIFQLASEVEEMCLPLMPTLILLSITGRSGRGISVGGFSSVAVATTFTAKTLLAGEAAFLCVTQFECTVFICPKEGVPHVRPEFPAKPYCKCYGAIETMNRLCPEQQLFRVARASWTTLSAR